MDKEFYIKKSNIIKALANPHRLMIIDCLLEGPKNVSEIVQITSQEQSYVSKSLSLLRKNGLVDDKKDGLNVYYSLKVCCMAQFFTCINKMLKDSK